MNFNWSVILFLILCVVSCEKVSDPINPPPPVLQLSKYELAKAQLGPHCQEFSKKGFRLTSWCVQPCGSKNTEPSCPQFRVAPNKDISGQKCRCDHQMDVVFGANGDQLGMDILPPFSQFQPNR